MDPNDDDINEEQIDRDHLIRSAAAITVAAVAVAIALDEISTDTDATDTDAMYISEQVAESNQVNHSPDVPELDPLLDLENDEEPGYTEIPTPQTEYSTRRRGRPCGGSSCSQQSKKKVAVDRLIDPITRLVDAIISSSVGSNEKLIAQGVNEAVSEMYEHDTMEKMSAATIFLMKNKWAANTILSAPKERRVSLMDAMMHPSTSNR